MLIEINYVLKIGIIKFLKFIDQREKFTDKHHNFIINEALQNSIKMVLFTLDLLLQSIKYESEDIQ